MVTLKRIIGCLHETELQGYIKLILDVNSIERVHSKPPQTLVYVRLRGNDDLKLRAGELNCQHQ